METQKYEGVAVRNNAILINFKRDTERNLYS